MRAKFIFFLSVLAFLFCFNKESQAQQQSEQEPAAQLKQQIKTQQGQLYQLQLKEQIVALQYQIDRLQKELEQHQIELKKAEQQQVQE